jgi:hypothetical protein
MRRINEIRMAKKKPRLTDILKQMKGKDLQDPKAKEDFKKKILALYDNEHQKVVEVDTKYEKLMGSFDRI